MGALRPKNKAVSSVPKEFLPDIRYGLRFARERTGQPLSGIPDIQQGLGIKPGIEAGPEQRQGVGQLQSTLPDVSGLFRGGTAQQAGTIGGRYLDPTQVPAFQNLRESLLTTGQSTFEDLLNQARQSAARGGIFRSSAAEAAEAGAARRVASDIAENLARAGTSIYGQERGAQEAASARGVAGLPDVAGQLFTMGDVLTRLPLADLQSRLQAAQGAQGLRDVPLSQIVSLIGALGGQNTQQPSGGQMALSAIGGLLNPAQSLFGGK